MRACATRFAVTPPAAATRRCWRCAYPRPRRTLGAAVLLLATMATAVPAQGSARDTTMLSLLERLWARVDSAPREERRRQPLPWLARFDSREDSLAFELARDIADAATGYRVVISIFDRQLWVIDGSDTLRTAVVGVASGDTLAYDGRVWTFRTPRGRREVVRRTANPVWVPPDWHYVEVAKERGLHLAWLTPGEPRIVSGGRRLELRAARAGLVTSSGSFAPLPLGEEIVFGDTLYVPPIGSENRRVRGPLGRHMLDLGDGYLLHGTPDQLSIGAAATHGCVRLADADIEWLFRHVKPGTPVFIY
jgi:hypothetical protein